MSLFLTNTNVKQLYILIYKSHHHIDRNTENMHRDSVIAYRFQAPVSKYIRKDFTKSCCLNSRCLSLKDFALCERCNVQRA